MLLLDVQNVVTGDFWKDINASNNILDFVFNKNYYLFYDDKNELKVKVQFPFLFFAKDKDNCMYVENVINFGFLTENKEKAKTVLLNAVFDCFIGLSPEVKKSATFYKVVPYTFPMEIVAKRPSDVERYGLEIDWFLKGFLYKTIDGYNKDILIPVEFDVN